MGNVQGKLDFRYHQGSVQCSVDGGTTWANVAGDSLSSAQWRTAITARVTAIDPTLSMCWSTDCNNITAELVLGTAAGTGDAALESTTNGGSILTSTGTTNNSNRNVEMRDAIVTSPPARLVSNTRTQKWGFYKRAQMVALANASGKVSVIASFLDGTNDIAMGMRGSVSAANWALFVGLAGAGVDLGVAADLNVHDFFVYNDGTDVKAYLDWTQIGASTPASGIAAAAGYPRWYDFNGTTGQNVSHRSFKAAAFVVEP